MYVIKWLWCSNSCGMATELFYGGITDMLFLHLSHEHEPTRDSGSPTRDPAMNSVIALATFDVCQFLADNVGVVLTCPDMSPTFPTKTYPNVFVANDYKHGNGMNNCVELVTGEDLGIKSLSCHQ